MSLPPGFGPPEPAHGALPAGFGPPEPVAEAPGVGESVLRGAAQGASLGFADELTGGAEALLDKLKGAHEALGELYLKHRNESRANYKAAESENPVAYGAGQLGGGLATMAIPGLGAGGVVAQAGKMAALGAAAGLGSSEAEDAPTMVKDAAVSGFVGGAAGGVGALVGKAIGALGNKVAPSIQKAADEATVAGAYGRAGVKGVEDVGGEAAFLRERNLTGPLATPASVAKKAGAQIEQGNAGRVEALKGLDTQLGEMAPGIHVSGNEMADRLEIEAAKLGQNPNRTSAQEGFLDKASGRYREMGDEPMTFDQADKYIRGFGEGAGPGTAGVRNSAQKALREQMLERAGVVNPVAADQIRDAGQVVSRLHGVEDAASAAPASGFQMPYSATHGAMMVLKKTVANPSLRGSAFDKLATLAKTNPAALGKWGGYLAAAAQRGPAALATTHYSLSQNDREYAAQVRIAMDAADQ